MAEVTLLIDGDVVAFRAAAAVQKVEDDGFGYIRPFASIVEGKAAVDSHLLRLMDGLGATHMRIALSDPDANWRFGVDASYKGNRGDSVRPLLLGVLKDHLREAYGAFHKPALEADDVLGILATERQAFPGRRIVVGLDKDFKSIPGLHHTLGDEDDSGRPRVVSIAAEEADAFHLIQTLAGDRVDGYDGCPGLGMERAARIVSAPVVLTPERGVITRGANKGKETVKWVAAPTDDLWACVVSHYAKAGLKEEDALRTARLARILRAEDYDVETETLRLWTPPQP